MRVSYLLIAGLLLCSPLARGDPWQYEFLFMPSAQAVGTFNRTAPITEIVPQVVQVDTLFTIQRGPFKLFGESPANQHLEPRPPPRAIPADEYLAAFPG